MIYIYKLVNVTLAVKILEVFNLRPENKHDRLKFRKNKKQTWDEYVEKKERRKRKQQLEKEVSDIDYRR